MANRILKALWAYLKNWKNLLTHALIGVGILLVALVLPVRLPIRIGILAAVIAANILRMRLEKRRRRSEPSDSE